MSREFRLFNTLTRQIDKIDPVTPGEVKMYCCGPTVYNYAHLGNLRTYLFEDVLIRSIRFAGYKVTHVMNITDVGHLTGDADDGEDKMIVAMKREGKTSHEIADFYTLHFMEDSARLNIRRPDIVCKATEHVGDMIKLVQRLEKNGFTYISGGNVYFDTSRFPDYGKLALHKLDEDKIQSRVDVDKSKKNPFDFVLWFTKSKFENQELQWDSPWGRGYPGWHIECSAMSIRHLGEQIDIHCGGVDHVPVHHTNEIAQSEAATGKKPWVKMWIHGEFMQVNAEKMAKSKGNFLTVDDLLKRGCDPLAYRFLVLGSHYRSQLNFTWPVLDNAKNALDSLKSTVISLKAAGAPAGELNPQAKAHLEKFAAALCDDLNTPVALAAVNAAAADKTLGADQKLKLLYTMDEVLGLGMEKWEEEKIEVTPELQILLDARQQARTSKNWAEADKIRDQIAALGFVVKDSPQGPVLKRK